MERPAGAVLNDNPVIAFLGRRGRGAVVEALRRNPRRALSVRELARLADVAPMVASRAVAELGRFGAVTVERDGKALRVRFQPASAVGAFLARLEVPDAP
jgi:DNA-binding transcriptional ArsR family regulator